MMQMERLVCHLHDNPSSPLFSPLGMLNAITEPSSYLPSLPYSTFVGALGQAFTADSIGRRGSILVWSAIFTAGTAIQTGTTFSIAQITIGRFIAGLGVGALSGTPRHTGRPSVSDSRLQLLYHCTPERPLPRNCVECCSSYTSCKLLLGEYSVRSCL